MIYIVVGKAEPVTRPRPPRNRACDLHRTRRKQTGLKLNTPASLSGLARLWYPSDVLPTFSMAGYARRIHIRFKS